MPTRSSKPITDFIEEKDGKMVFSFGQFKGRPIDDVAQESPVFLRFVLDKFKTMPETQKLALEQALDNATSSLLNE